MPTVVAGQDRETQRNGCSTMDEGKAKVKEFRGEGGGTYLVIYSGRSKNPHHDKDGEEGKKERKVMEVRGWIG